MCGIAGVYDPHGDRSEWSTGVRAMVDAMAHRGPDDTGFFEAPGVSLGISRLEVMDPETGAQPITNEDGSVTLVANCEIYDFEGIRRDLLGRGHRFRSFSDAEVLVHLYEEVGLDLFDHIEGMFAFALWDARRQRLLLARDPFGVKPLFWARSDSGRTLAFASELNPLLGLPGQSHRLDSVAIDHFLALSYIPHPRTAYSAVSKLRPGHLMTADADGTAAHPFWTLHQVSPERNGGDPLASLDAAVGDSVSRMMRSDVPVGAFLSGGLDSSTIVYHMARLTDTPVRTFSFRFQERSFDEGDHARATSELLGTRHQEVWGRPDDVREVGTLCEHFGEPFADPSQIPTFLIAKAAAESVRVILSGDGGDEVLGGYETYCASLFSRLARPLPDPLRRTLLRATHALPVSTTKHVGWNHRIRKFLAGCHLPPWDHHAMWRTVFDANERRRLYTPDHAAALGADLEESVFAAHRGLFDDAAGDRLTPFQFLDLHTYLTDNNLVKADRMSMANSLELRVPFLDRRVLAAALTLPPELRVRGFATKVSLRRLMRGRLPREVVRGRKRGFGVPLAAWLRGPLRGFLIETLAEARVDAVGCLRAPVVSGLVREHLHGTANRARQLWSLICLVSWYERHVAREGRCPSW